MSDPRPSPNFDTLAAFEPVIDRFEAALRTDQRPELKEFLTDVPENLHAAFFGELLALEWDYRRVSGESPQASEYLARFPQFASHVRAVAAAVDAPKPKAPVCLKVRCPHCHNPIEVIDEDPSGDVSCPSCGSSFNLAKDVATGRFLDAGRKLGHFQLLDRLGQGAFGEVWKARDTELDRIVAIKIPRREHLTEQETEQFLREARAAAQVRHPNIVSVYEIGREHGMIYIASDFIDGATLSEWIEAHPLTVRESVELCATVAEALHHAHEAGVVHRDLKPQNILVRSDELLVASGEQPQRSSPNSPLTTRHSQLIPFITDFGLAKRDAGEITMTVEGAILGTPAYMSPEQARGEAHHADRRSDVYSLGVILFRLLTGELPFRGQRQMLLVQILNEEPPALRKLDARLPRDVETICLKCLEKDPARRYPSAAALAADLRRWLTGHPIQARPVSRTERAWRWCHRNPAVASLSAAVVLVLLTGIAVSSFFSVESSNRAKDLSKKQFELLAETRRANQNAADANAKAGEAVAEKVRANVKATEALAEKTRADAKAAEARRNLYVSRMNLAPAAWEDAHVGRVLYLLKQHEPQPGEDDLRGFEWHYWNRLAHSYQLSLEGHTGRVFSVVFSADGKRLASASYDQTVKVWDAVSGQEMLTLKGHTSYVTSVTFSADGKRLASSGSYGDGTVKVWDATSGLETLTFRGHSGPVWSVAFSADGKRLASASEDQTVKVWNATSGEETLTLKGHTRRVQSVAFSADGKRLASASEDQTVKVWDATSGKETLTLKGHTAQVTSVSFSADGNRLASASLDRTVKVWDTTSGEETLTFKGHTAQVMSVSFSPDGNRLASASFDRTVKVWDATNGQETLTLKGHADRVSCVALSADGKRLASASSDQTVKVWDATSGQETLTLKGHGGQVFSVAFSGDEKWVASASLDKTVKVWDAASGQETLTLKGHGGSVVSVAFSADGKRLASASGNQTVKVWDATSGQEMLTLQGHTSYVTGVTFSADGKRLASASSDGTVKVWDATNGQETLTLKKHAGPVMSVTFSADGKRLASASDDQLVKVWDATSGEETLTLEGHTDRVLCVALSADGKRLASASGDGTVKVWDATSGQEMITLKGHTGYVMSVAFSADGKRLASASHDGTVKVWDARPWTPELRAEFEAVGLLKFWCANPISKEKLLQTIRDDATISDAVQQRTLELAEKYWRLEERRWVDHPVFLTAERKQANLLRHGSFEENGTEAHWLAASYRQNRQAGAITAETAHLGKRSVSLATDIDDDVYFTQEVSVQPHTDYLLSGWVKTDGVKIFQEGGTVGANLSLLDIYGHSKSITGTNDWTYLAVQFNSSDRTKVRLGARLGHNGSTCTGKAWFDDLNLTPIDPPKVSPPPNAPPKNPGETQ